MGQQEEDKVASRGRHGRDIEAVQRPVACLTSERWPGIRVPQPAHPVSAPDRYVPPSRFRKLSKSVSVATEPCQSGFTCQRMAKSEDQTDDANACSRDHDMQRVSHEQNNDRGYPATPTVPDGTGSCLCTMLTAPGTRSPSPARAAGSSAPGQRHRSGPGPGKSTPAPRSPASRPATAHPASAAARP